MEFTFETAYDQKAMTAMARALRKTIRKKSSRRSHVFGGIIVVISVLLALPLGAEEPVLDFRSAITWLVALALLAVLIWEDAINGRFAKKHLLPGMGKSVSVFSEEGYHSVTDLGETAWHYDKISAIAETPAYFVFLFGKNHAQVYDKRTISGGTVEAFRSFIEEKTGKMIQTVR